MYEYKSILLATHTFESIDDKSCKVLNSYFDKGWEYVNSICQVLSQGSNGTEYGPVIVVLRKMKENVTL